jgi:hypothetical protein
MCLARGEKNPQLLLAQRYGKKYYIPFSILAIHGILSELSLYLDETDLTNFRKSFGGRI